MDGLDSRMVSSQAFMNLSGSTKHNICYLVNDMPIATAMAGVNMRLKAGAIR